MSTAILGKVTIVPKGAYNAASTYNRLDLVTYNGSSFVARVDGLQGVTPVDGANWQLLAAAGIGASIQSQTYEYATQAAADYTGQPPASGWSSTVPTVTGGNYLWVRVTTAYTDGSSYQFYVVSRYGVDGTGAVSTVNGVSPDATGNVALTLGSIATVDPTPTSGSTNLVTSGGVNAFVYAITSPLGNGISQLSETKANLSVARSVTIEVADWNNGVATKSVTGVTASNNIVVSPAPSSFTAYAEAVIRATAQGSGTVTFTCDSEPTDDVTVNVMIVG